MSHVVVFAGEYDLANKQGVRRAFRRLESSDNLVLDLTEVTYIDSTFITELMLLEKARLANNFARATIVSREGSSVRRLFNVCGLAAFLGLVESYVSDPDGDPDSIVEFAETDDCLDVTPGIKPGDYVSLTRSSLNSLD